MKKSVRPFAYWGSKAQMAPWIVQRLPSHSHFVDCCAGSAVVLAVKPPSLLETLNDVNREITNFFRVLQDKRSRDRLIEKVTFTPYSKVEFLGSFSVDENDDPIDFAFSFFIRMQMAVVPGKTGWSYCADGSAGKKAAKPQRWDSMPEHLWMTYRRFKNVQIMNEDICVLMKRMDRPGTLFFVDPPYLPESRPESIGNKSAYLHDSFDFTLFRDACRRLIWSEVIVTHYDHPFFDDGLWNVVGDFRSHRNAPATTGRSVKVERMYRMAV